MPVAARSADGSAAVYGVIVAGTGHRKTGLSDAALTECAARHLKEIAPEIVISGMALGWDMAIAEAADSLGLPFIAAVPFLGQDRAWSDDQRRRYAALLLRAEEVFVIGEVVCDASFERRNRWMIDRSDLLLAFWDGSLNGGTANAIRYAEKKRVRWTNAWGRIS